MLFVGETNIESVYYNDVELDEVYYNNVLVWKKWQEKTGRLGEIDFSSNEDWFTSPVKHLGKMIIPLEIEVHFYYNFFNEQDSVSTSTGLFANSNGVDIIKHGISVPRPSSGSFGSVYQVPKDMQVPIDRYGAGGGGGTSHGTHRVTACITKWLEGSN